MEMMSTKDVKAILASMYGYRSQMVPCFIGDPGIGKTQGLHEFAEEKGVNVVTFILSNTVPSEVSGIRMPDRETKRMEVFDDMRMASLKDGDILFFDEILEAPPMLWSACLTLIQDRIMASGKKLPDVFIVAASNRVASPSIIPASTRDRFQFIELAFDFDHWARWVSDRYGKAVPEGLRHKIKGDSTEYNILTPRRATKLITWLAMDEKPDKIKLDVIRTMFDDPTMRLLAEAAFSKLDAKSQVINAVRTVVPDIEDVTWIDGFGDTVGIHDMSLKTMFEKLQQLREWQDIAKVLANTQFDQEELDLIGL